MPHVIAYTYEADHHCPDCARVRFGDTLDNPDTEDSEGNGIGACFSTDEHDNDVVCGDCGEVLEEVEGKPIQDFIAENRTALYTAIWKLVPNLKLDDDDVEQWIANDEGLYDWARKEGVKI